MIWAISAMTNFLSYMIKVHLIQSSYIQLFINSNLFIDRKFFTLLFLVFLKFLDHE